MVLSSSASTSPSIPFPTPMTRSGSVDDPYYFSSRSEYRGRGFSFSATPASPSSPASSKKESMSSQGSTPSLLKSPRLPLSAPNSPNITQEQWSEPARRSISNSKSNTSDLTYNAHSYFPLTPKHRRSSSMRAPSKPAKWATTSHRGSASSLESSSSLPEAFGSAGAPLGLVCEDEQEGSEAIKTDGGSSWYVSSFGKGTMQKQSYHPYDYSVAPYFISYSHGALNWDSLLNAALWDVIGTGSAAYAPNGTFTPTPPKRVFDLGAGPTAPWCLGMAYQPGWEATHFTALDLAPSALIENPAIPQDILSRFSLVQHNFLQGLPFEEDRFEYVRLAYAGLGIPEHQWDGIVEEMNRVLAPGGTLEIMDCDFSVYRVKPSSAEQDLDEDVDDPFAAVEECVDAVLDKGFINRFGLVCIPSALAINCSRMQASGSFLIDLPARPPPALASTVPLPPRENLVTNLFRPVGIAPEPRKLLLPPSRRAVYLHAYAERFANSSNGLSQDAADRRERATLAKNPASLLRHDKVVQELSDNIAEWCDDLKERAGLPQILTNDWGWNCSFDEQMANALETNLPIFVDRLQAYDSHYDGLEGDYELDPQVEFRKLQIQFAKREAEVDLRDVQRRLGSRDWSQDSDTIGYLEYAAFLAKARV